MAVKVRFCGRFASRTNLVRRRYPHLRGPRCFPSSEDQRASPFGSPAIDLACQPSARNSPRGEVSPSGSRWRSLPYPRLPAAGNATHSEHVPLLRRSKRLARYGRSRHHVPAVRTAARSPLSEHRWCVRPQASKEFSSGKQTGPCEMATDTPRRPGQLRPPPTPRKALQAAPGSLQSVHQRSVRPQASKEFSSGKQTRPSKTATDAAPAPRGTQRPATEATRRDSRGQGEMKLQCGTSD